MLSHEQALILFYLVYGNNEVGMFVSDTSSLYAAQVKTCLPNVKKT
jgi:hypothetical protein